MLEQDQGHPHTDCRVFLMSDRQRTLGLLSEWVELQNCTAVQAKHEVVGFSFSREHGPFAGSDYFRDLALAATARDGLVGMDRSSTMLLRELMSYDRRIRLGLSASPLPFCKL